MNSEKHYETQPIWNNLSTGGIISEIDRPPDFNENFSTNIVSSNDIRFLRKLSFKKLFSFKVIYFICKSIACNK